MMIYLLLFSPLLGFLLNSTIFYKSNKVSHIIGSFAIFLSFISSVFLFVDLLNNDFNARVYHLFSWIKAGDLNIPFSVALDRLSIFMSLMVSFIAFIIHVYSGGYMKEEKNLGRFFSYLNLFVFMMLMLILSSNIVVMFVGWEGVGLCSYLLIGYWYKDENNSDAGKKAFIINRIGDIGFLIGIFLIYKYFGSFSFDEIEKAVLSLELTDIPVTFITLFLFLAVTGKSAQIPLYNWLPDAMAGPTPVSALIHAATMVTAGVFMMTRMNYLFFAAPVTMGLISFIGIFTAFFAATIAVLQTDIKKVLAYSTISQLGYMVTACGVGAFSAGLFHLLTHASFKALLFLGAGSVITALHHNQDIMKMGGLKKYMPKTYMAFLIGVLAIIGIPPFSGFFSKDEILWYSYLNGGIFLWLIAVLTAAMTAFYMVRLFILTFHGKSRFVLKENETIKETPSNMWMSLFALAFIAAFIGFLGIPEFISGYNIFHHFIGPMIKKHSDYHHDHILEWTLMIISLLIVFMSSLVAYLRYKNFSLKPAKPNIFKNIIFNGYYIDILYINLFVKSLRKISFFVFGILDNYLINNFFDNSAKLFKKLSFFISKSIKGDINQYNLVFIIGFVITIIFII